MTAPVTQLQAVRGKIERNRYAGRKIDVPALLAAPEKPIPWRVQGVAADGYATVIPGMAGSGKSWLWLACADGVTRGKAVGELQCTKGAALYFDAEMGEVEFKRRHHVSGYGEHVQLYDVLGLDLRSDADRAWMMEEIGNETQGKGGLVVIDSLRRMTPGAAENDSDSMAFAVAAVTQMARETRAAFVVIHHMGWDGRHSRGSVSIFDQCDAMLNWSALTEDGTVCELSCEGTGTKMRFAKEPPKRYFAFDERRRIDAGDPELGESKLDQYRVGILRALPFQNQKTAAESCGASSGNSTWRQAWDEHTKAQRFARNRDGSFALTASGQEWLSAYKPAHQRVTF